MTATEIAHQMDEDRNMLMAIVSEHLTLKNKENRTEEEEDRFRLLNKALKAFERIE